MATTNVERVVLICGDRNWKAPGPIYELCKTFPLDGRTIIITGGASGADSIAAAAAVDLGHRSMVINAPWKAYGKRAGPVRNAWMMEIMDALIRQFSATGEVHAFHEQLAQSKGTVDMIRRARAAAASGSVITLKVHTDSGERTMPATLFDV